MDQILNLSKMKREKEGNVLFNDTLNTYGKEPLT